MPKDIDSNPGIRMQNLQYQASDGGKQQRMEPDRIHVYRGFDTTFEPASDGQSESELIPQRKEWDSAPEGRWGSSTVDVEGAYAQRSWMS